MSSLRTFLGKLPRPSGHRATFGAAATAVSAAAATGYWYLQQNADERAPTPNAKQEARRAAEEEMAMKEATKRTAEEEAAKKAQNAAEEAKPAVEKKA